MSPLTSGGGSHESASAEVRGASGSPGMRVPEPEKVEVSSKGKLARVLLTVTSAGRRLMMSL